MKKAEDTQAAVVAPEKVGKGNTFQKEEMPLGAEPELLNVPLGDPFSKRVRGSELVVHQQVNELREMILAAISQGCMILVSGPPGVGKTTGVRYVTDELPPNKYTVVYLGQDQHGINLLNRIAEALGLPGKRFRQHIVLQLSQWLTANVKDNGKSLVLIVDEAHLLDDNTLEELRLLSNADYDRQSSFSLILIAQPWLRTRLKTPFFEPLSQRIRYRYSFEGLSQEDTIKYVRVRIAAAGLPEELFTQDALPVIFSYSEGIPRKINNLCSYLLLKARNLGVRTIDAALVKNVADTMDI